MPYKADFTAKKIIQDRDYMNIKMHIQQEDTEILTVCASKNRAVKLMKQKLTELK